MTSKYSASVIKERLAAHPLLHRLWVFPAALLWLELLLRLGTIGFSDLRGLPYVLGFTLAGGLFLHALCALFSPRVNRILTLVLLGSLTILYMAQAVYYCIFKVFFTLFSVGGAGQVTQFLRVILSAMATQWWVLILLTAPFVCLLRGTRTMRDAGGWRVALLPLLCCVLIQGITTCCVLFDTAGAMNASRLYTTDFISNLSVNRFGMLTTFRIEARNSLFGPLAAVGDSESDALPVDGSAISTPQTMEIDFPSLIESADDPTLRSMHQYFSLVTPSEENEYTGRFAGKNLIFLTCESLWKYAIDENVTPTLYRLSQEGFRFTNFYNPIWGVSTLDGEYVNCLGVIPVTGTWSFNEAATKYLPFALGNQFNALGCTSRAYHDHTYSYYNRQLSHPNMGYTYKGLGGGLPLVPSWPESDLEMMQKTVDEYITDERFLAYYMTVSGHLEYNFFGNEMAIKNYDAVKGLPLPEAAQAYLACNIELDRALEYLLSRLEEANKLNDTVIVLCPDHYPYGLDTESLNALAGHPLNTDYELYQSCCLIWCGDMQEPVTIEKPVSSLDILPTISNLFDLPYDSRLMMGRDMLSDEDSPVIFEDHSWLTASGYYNAAGDTYTAFAEREDTDSYIAGMNRTVGDRFYYSKLILRNDYYRVLFPQGASSEGE